MREEGTFEVTDRIDQVSLPVLFSCRQEKIKSSHLLMTRKILLLCLVLVLNPSSCFTQNVLGDARPDQDDCLPNEFSCHNGKCVYVKLKCNGFDDCGDNSDELTCPPGVRPEAHPGLYQCGPNRFSCTDLQTGNFRCFWNMQKCDGNVDCKDLSDESHCDGDTTDECPNEYDQRFAPRDQISSPNYPSLYSSTTCYNWFIRGHQNDIITISFSDIDIPAGPSGDCDYGRLNLGPMPSVLICGGLKNGYPKVYISEKDHVWIKFRTSGQLTGRGFNMLYIRGAVPSREVCLVDEFTCRNGKCILLKWKCNGADECGDGSDELGCPPVIPPQVTPGPYDCGPNKFSCTDKVSREYRCMWNKRLCDGIVDCEDGRDESKCDGAKPCRTALEGPSGFFSSPWFGTHPYDNNLRCSWIIHGSLGSVIQLRFIIFDLEVTPGTDAVSVYDGESADAWPLGVYYGGNIPPKTIESTSNRMFVMFDTNEAIQRQGFNASYQMKGFCLRHQKNCSYGENDCYDISAECDGHWDCPLHGGDERGCGHCQKDLFQCNSKGTQCYLEKEHCNGVAHCNDNQDEKNCTPLQCGPHNGTFLCRNRHCIYESWSCDGTNDCGDNSDEIHCSQPSVKVITAAVIGSLICGLLLVIALGCTCKLYALRLQEHQGSSSRYTSPLTRLQEEIYARRLAPPPYNEAMLTSRPFSEVQQEYLQHICAAGAARPHRHRGRGSHGRTRSERAHRNRSTSQEEGNTNNNDGTNSNNRLEETSDEELLDVGNNNTTAGSELQVLEPQIESSDSDSDSELEICPSVESSNVSISIATGMSAQWRRAGMGRGRVKRERLNPAGLPSPQVEEGRSGGEGTETNPNPDTASTSLSMDSMVLLLGDGKDSEGSDSEVVPPSVIVHQPSSSASPAPVHRQFGMETWEGSDGMSVRSLESLEPSINTQESNPNLPRQMEEDDETAPLVS